MKRKPCAYTVEELRTGNIELEVVCRPGLGVRIVEEGCVVGGGARVGGQQYTVQGLGEKSTEQPAK